MLACTSMHILQKLKFGKKYLFLQNKDKRLTVQQMGDGAQSQRGQLSCMLRPWSYP